MTMAREGGLLAWQWRHYAENHRNRLNLWIHFVAVPTFVGAALAAAQLLVTGRYVVAGLAFVVMVGAFALQALGHKREAVAPIPFDGVADFAKRVFAEQFITFPRFVLSRGFARQSGGHYQD
ncbi:MAG: DUF962 domain-containing protein [Chiayiivirga sp.]|jgi:hypothetical protein|uniref:Mpo1-like protein n=1 Tax=Chiayiivirga sp. TaxID=2041042 RepID=UPI0025C07606|nr:Mpo1-like protein [Chiayiivirga sp.]MCI1709657.1 DUF962 domain-containing protein [Chiayiivirga sp.]MCI1730054.1 DUF962 domain-containing protein [Chiayiivirga sp.]